MECINLREQFGHRYRITFDPAYDPQHRPKDNHDPWMMRIPSERGTILPHGGRLLVVEVERRPVTANRLRRLACTTTIQDGEGFLAATFDVADIDEVAAIVKPRRRRQISEKERKRLQALSAQYGFKSQLHQSARS